MRGLPAIALLLVSSPLWAAPEESSLPSWAPGQREEMMKSGWVPGAMLLTDEPVPHEVQPEPAAQLEVEKPKPEEIAGDLKPSPEIPDKFLPAYFAERPKNFLVDPQGLLSPKDYRDRLGFLNYHASDSGIDLFVYVIGGDQEVPSEVRKEETIERFFSEGRPAAIIYYYLGAPQRSIVYLSPSITDAISASEQRRALESSVLQAFERTNPSEQFEKFLVQMSIRLYWMERILSGKPLASTEPAYTTPAPVPAATRKAKGEHWIWVRDLAAPFAIPAAACAGLFLLAFGMTHWLRLRARYRFPEFEIEPRLGGDHAAGVGAVISFASAALPPASQRDQVPDYLRRA